MLNQLAEHFHSIRFKIALLLFLVLSLSLGTAMFGTWTYQRDQFIDMANQEAMRGGETIEKSLRHAMLTNNKATIQETVEQIAAIYDPPSRISVIGLGGVVAVSNDPAMLGQVFDRFSEPTCIVCHQLGNSTPDTQAIIINTDEGPLLRNVIKIKNEPACYQCHPATQTNLGILIYDAYFSRTFELLKTVALRMLFTGLFTFLIITIVLILVINRYIQQPIQNLSDGFMHAGQGDYDFWVYEDSSTEFNYMADSFNIMSRAIGRYIGEIKSKNVETSILYSIVQELSETIEWERLQRIIVDLLNTVFQAKVNGLIVPQHKKENCVDIIWRTGDTNRIFRERFCTKGKINFPGLNREQLLLWQEGNLKSYQFSDDRQTLLIPLKYNQESIGLLCIQRERNRKFSRHEQAIIPALASHIAISLANSRLYHMASTDGLTDLYSKRYFLDKLEALEAQHKQDPHAAWFIIMLDIDHFKAVNDTYGHQEGDQVLMEVAEIMRRHIRFEDIAFRYGGEEFTVLVPAAANEQQLGPEIAERLRHQVESHPFVCQGGIVINLTISLGVAHFPGNSTSTAQVVQAADTALYKAKRNGRNQVQIADDSVSSPTGL